MNATSYNLLHDMKLYLSYLLVRKTSTSVLKLLTVGALTAAFGSLFQVFTTLFVKLYFLMSR